MGKTPYLWGEGKTESDLNINGLVAADIAPLRTHVSEKAYSFAEGGDNDNFDDGLGEPKVSWLNWLIISELVGGEESGDKSGRFLMASPCSVKGSDERDVEPSSDGINIIDPFTGFALIIGDISSK